jgi:hypothetical protein
MKIKNSWGSWESKIYSGYVLHFLMKISQTRDVLAFLAPMQIMKNYNARLQKLVFETL